MEILKKWSYIWNTNPFELKDINASEDGRKIFILALIRRNKVNTIEKRTNF